MIRGWRIDISPEATTEERLHRYDFVIANMMAEHKVTDSQIIKSGSHIIQNGRLIDRIECIVDIDPETRKSIL